MTLRNQHLVLLLIGGAALLRLAPHPDNIAPIGALALFSGAYLQRQVLWLVPLGALLLGDAATGFYAPLVMVFVYLGFIASTGLGRGLLRGRDSWLRIAMATATGALAFWLVSNLGVWLAFYPLTLAGLLDCFVQGIPYLFRSMMGDAVYVTALFGMYKILTRVSFVAPVRAV